MNQIQTVWNSDVPSKSPLFTFANRIPLHWMYSQWIYDVCNDLIEIPNADWLFELHRMHSHSGNGRMSMSVCVCDHLLGVKLSHDKSKSCVHGFVFQKWRKKIKIAQFLCAAQRSLSFGTYKFKAHWNQTLWVLWIYFVSLRDLNWRCQRRVFRIFSSKWMTNIWKMDGWMGAPSQRNLINEQIINYL